MYNKKIDSYINNLNDKEFFNIILIKLRNKIKNILLLTEFINNNNFYFNIKKNPFRNYNNYFNNYNHYIITNQTIKYSKNCFLQLRLKLISETIEAIIIILNYLNKNLKQTQLFFKNIITSLEIYYNTQFNNNKLILHDLQLLNNLSLN